MDGKPYGRDSTALSSELHCHAYGIVSCLQPSVAFSWPIPTHKENAGLIDRLHDSSILDCVLS